MDRRSHELNTQATNRSDSSYEDSSDNSFWDRISRVEADLAEARIMLEEIKEALDR